METESKYLKKIRDNILKKLGKTPSSPGPNTKAKYLNDIANAVDEWNPGGGGGSDLPLVTSDDNGKILKVIEGSWNKGDDNTGEDIVVVTATPIENDDEHVELDVTVSQIYTYLSEGKTVFIDYYTNIGNLHRYSLINRADGFGWAFIFLRNNWNEVTNEPYLECSRIVSGNNNDPYVADYGYVTYPLGGGAEKFVINVTMDGESSEVEADKTYAEVVAAYAEGKQLFVNFSTDSAYVPNRLCRCSSIPLSHVRGADNSDFVFIYSSMGDGYIDFGEVLFQNLPHGGGNVIYNYDTVYIS